MRIFRIFTDGNQTLKQGDKEFDVRGSVHRSRNYIEMTNEMQLFTRIYYSTQVFLGFPVSTQVFLGFPVSKSKC